MRIVGWIKTLIFRVLIQPTIYIISNFNYKAIFLLKMMLIDTFL